METTMDAVNQQMAAEESVEFNKNQYESAKTEVLNTLITHKTEITEEIDIFKQALEDRWSNPASEEGQAIKAAMERYVKEDEAALKWMDQPEDNNMDARNLVAARTERFAEFALFFGKAELGGERILEPQKGLTDQERLSIEQAGKLFYSANILRTHKTEEAGSTA